MPVSITPQVEKHNYISEKHNIINNKQGDLSNLTNQHNIDIKNINMKLLSASFEQLKLLQVIASNTAVSNGASTAVPVSMDNSSNARTSTLSLRDSFVESKNLYTR